MPTDTESLAFINQVIDDGESELPHIEGDTQRLITLTSDAERVADLAISNFRRALFESPSKSPKSRRVHEGNGTL